LIVEKRGLYADVGSEQLGSVVEHLIRNAQDATPSDGRIEVLVQQIKETAVIEISDTGHGMTTAFVRDRLFKPFESTKGGRGMGIGAYQAREFARSHGGDICVESSPGRGTTVRVMLPILKVAEVA
jgi:signal transduction histidine kinase